MNASVKVFFALLVAAVFLGWTSSAVRADPLQGEVLKFQQVPMIATPIDGAVYYGHDELSTAWLSATAQGYAGVFMADDFADLLSTPVVHLRWWGSYFQPETADQRFVNKFLISFESDVPDPNPTDPLDFSHPGQNLLAQVVTQGVLSPGSGTFTEKMVAGSNPADPVYEYNAELALPFSQKMDTVYWLKIVALDDLSQTDPQAIRWGWHNRDYTIQDPLASTPPAVVPGEFNDGVIGVSPPQKIWHFQDDAVSGNVLVTPISGTPTFEVLQDGYAPQNYTPADGPSEIVLHSKDLAFELYTVPEPAAWLMLLGAGAMCFFRLRRK
jgi:hypothetical protein